MNIRKHHVLLTALFLLLTACVMCSVLAEEAVSCENCGSTNGHYEDYRIQHQFVCDDCGNGNELVPHTLDCECHVWVTDEDGSYCNGCGKTRAASAQATAKPQICGICGAEEECICADVLATLEDHNAYVNRLLNGEVCTKLCPVHCNDEEFLAALMHSRMELTDLPIVNDSAMVDGYICRICLEGDGCNCADKYIEAEGQYTFVQSLLSSGECTGLCPVHWEEYTNGNMYVIIANASANIRSGPDGSAAKITTAAYGEAFPFLGEEGNWYIIDVDGRTGYVVKNLSALQEYMGAAPTQMPTTTTTRQPAASAPTSTPCAHSSTREVELEFIDLGDGSWLQQVDLVCNSCGVILDNYWVGGCEIDAAIPSNTATPTPKPTATPCVHASTSKVEGPRTDYENGEWIQECYKICDNCGAVVDTFYRGGMNIDAAIPVN